MISFRHLQAVGLGADGVHLAVHLLQQEIELAAARLRAVGQRVPVREVAVKPRHLFADVGALRHAHHLLRQRRLIDRQRARQARARARAAAPRARSRPVSAAAAMRVDQTRQQRLARVEVGAQVRAFAHAHRLRAARSRSSTRLVDRRAQHRRRRRRPPAAARECSSACGSRSRSPGVSVALDQPALARRVDRRRQRLRELLVQLDLRRRAPGAAAATR